MTAIVEDDIRRAELIDYALQESSIRLAADPDFDLVFLETFALGIDIDAHNLRVRAQVPLPHLSGTAATAPNFQEEHGAVDEAGEMGFVSREVMLPLMNGSMFVIEKFRPKSQIPSTPARTAILIHDQRESL
jgi:hypothetical protein